MLNKLPEQIKQQIEKEGNERAEGWQDKMKSQIAKTEYELGAEAYAEKAQKLAEALKEFISMHETGLLPNRFTYLKGKEALAEWEKGGGV